MVYIAAFITLAIIAELAFRALGKRTEVGKPDQNQIYRR